MRFGPEFFGVELFETAILQREDTAVVERYTTEEEAARGHQVWVETYGGPAQSVVVSAKRIERKDDAF